MLFQMAKFHDSFLWLNKFYCVSVYMCVCVYVSVESLSHVRLFVTP